MRSLALMLLPAVVISGATRAEAQQFTGPRVEANVAYDRLGTTDDVNRGDTLEGARFGATAGYDAALSPTLVIGAEAGFGWTTGSVTVALPQNASASARFGRDLELLGRIGVRVAPRTLAYAKAGYANSRYRASYTSVQNGTAFTAAETVDQLRIGAGIEKALGRRAFVKGEYRFSTEIDSDSAAGDRHQLLLGAGIRF